MKYLFLDGGVVQRIDLSYWYKVGETIHPIAELTGEQTFASVFLKLAAAQAQITEILPILRTSFSNGCTFKGVLDHYISGTDFEKPFSAPDVWHIASSAQQFEIALKAEIGTLPTYQVTHKGGYNVDILTLVPQQAFPNDLVKYVEETKYDIEQAAKCLAFEVATAAAFHLHRMNEQVVHVYWDAITSGKKRPTQSSVGEYIKAMENEKVGDETVLFLQKGIQKLHRNPLIHEDDRETVKLQPQDAIDLFPIISSAISAMLPAIKFYKEQKAVAIAAITAFEQAEESSASITVLTPARTA